MALKSYDQNQTDKTPERPPPEPSGVACTERGCEGEMGIAQPRQKHPEIKTLARAQCMVCGWLGWV